MTAVLVCAQSQGATLQVHQLDDIDFGSVSLGTQRLAQRMRFCVSMTPAGPYQIIAYGTQANGEYALVDLDNVASPIRFEVFVSRGANRRRGRPLQPGIALRNLHAQQPRPNGDCRRFSQLTMQVQVNRQDLASAAVGKYRGELQITVSPE
ncbi:MAG: hypothetical protein AAF541_03725 [Pseudomonadota bacterium]